MKCCPNCINDRHLGRQIIPQLSSETGTCSYCGSESQPLISPIELREHFELLISVYALQPEGKTLAEWLKDDWAMFSHVRMDIAHTKELLSEILNNGDIVRRSFGPSEHGKSDALLRWEELRSELMHSNRFFPQTPINLDRLERLLPFLMLEEIDISRQWFRARIQHEVEIYPLAAMVAPPKHLASHGRANPAGIPYLYIASTALTAISETRPHTGEMVCVAEFSIFEGLKIVDLCKPRTTVSPFILSDEREVALLRSDIEFLEKLGQELTRPILRKSAGFDYIPSQYLCEFVKKCGFDGVMYRSSVGDGVNIALFNPSHASPIQVTQHLVSRVVVNII